MRAIKTRVLVLIALSPRTLLLLVLEELLHDRIHLGVLIHRGEVVHERFLGTHLHEDALPYIALDFCSKCSNHKAIKNCISHHLQNV